MQEEHQGPAFGRLRRGRLGHVQQVVQPVFGADLTPELLRRLMPGLRLRRSGDGGTGDKQSGQQGGQTEIHAANVPRESLGLQSGSTGETEAPGKTSQKLVDVSKSQTIPSASFERSRVAQW